PSTCSRYRYAALARQVELDETMNLPTFIARRMFCRSQCCQHAHQRRQCAAARRHRRTCDLYSGGTALRKGVLCKTEEAGNTFLHEGVTLTCADLQETAMLVMTCKSAPP